jgi:2-polyprenyl-3-methyl-5-hydroxy-6-metoxy-1,4-benzoquinol methylase
MNQWNKLAKDYQTGVLSQDRLLFPKLIHLINVEQDDRVGDFGCGSGQYAHHFYKKGANVVAIDDAPKQIELARKVFPGPDYRTAKIQDFKTEHPFDIILANMVTCNIPDYKALQDFFQSCEANLAPNGKLFVTDVHQYYKRNGDFGWLRNSNYIAEDGHVFNLELLKQDNTYLGPFENYHWAAQTLIKTAQRAGFFVNNSTILKSVEDTNSVHPTSENVSYYTLYEFKKK